MKSKNYWTKIRCEEESSKYESLEDFRKKGGYSYVKSYKNNWLIDFYTDYTVPEIKWSKENCINEALKFETLKDFRTKSKSAYSICLRNGWMDEIHKIFKMGCYWTIELCSEESKKYETKSQFKKNSYTAYKFAYINCLLDQICEHMPKIGNLYKRCIYAFEFSDNNVYIGLTYNIDVRQKQHYISTRSQVNKHYLKSGIEPELVQLTGYLNADVSKIKEGEYISIYKEGGWNILNVQKSGNLGGNNKKITKEICKEEALKYIYLKDFRLEKPNIYGQIVRYKWYDTCDFLIKSLPSPKTKWTKEKCKEEASKYNTKTEFEESNINAYNACVRNKWIQELCLHMVPKVRKPTKNYKF